jgi:hypothetical protein
MRMRAAALGWMALIAAGCAGGGQEGGQASGQAPTAPTTPARLGGSVLAGTQGGTYPLGPSMTQVGGQVATGTGGISLDGTVPYRLVRPDAQSTQPPTEPAGPRARMGGDVAYVPGAPDRLGAGMTARNGAGARSWGAAYVPTTEYVDVESSPTTGQGRAASQAGATGGGGGAVGGTSGTDRSGVAPAEPGNTTTPGTPTRVQRGKGKQQP